MSKSGLISTRVPFQPNESSESKINKLAIAGKTDRGEKYSTLTNKLKKTQTHI